MKDRPVFASMKAKFLLLTFCLLAAFIGWLSFSGIAVFRKSPSPPKLKLSQFVAVDERYHPITVTLHVDDALAEAIATKEDRVSRPLNVTCEFAGEISTQKATVSFWGQGSLAIANTPRRSYLVTLENSVRLNGKKLRRFILLSLFEDEARLKYHVSTRILSQFDLWPVFSSYVRLMFSHNENNNNDGVYYLIEFPPDAVGILPKIDNTTMLHMRNNRDQLLKISDFTTGSLNSDYRALLTAPDTVSEKLDTDRYLTWLALNSLLMNGDYLDEVFFYKQNGLLTLMGWDYDSTWDTCHTNGKPLTVSPDEHEYKLLWCPQSKLDNILIKQNKATWKKYKFILYGILQQIRADVYCDLVNHARTELETIFESDSSHNTLNQTFSGQPIPDFPETASTYCTRFTARWEELSTNFQAKGCGLFD